MFLESGYPEMAFSRGGLLRSASSLRSPDLPSLSSNQAEALDYVHFTAAKTALSLDWEEGDVLMFSNRKVLHARESFTDAADTTRPRHMLRLWLQDEALAGPPPAALKGRWERLFNTVSDEDNDHDRWPVEPISIAQEAVSNKLRIAY